MADVAIVFFSGYGHTARLAKAVHEGAAAVPGATAHLVPIGPEGEVDEAAWTTLAGADAIIFGSPTYMGNVAWQFKKFADASSKPWFGQVWKDKIAAGFTNSATMNGDKFSTMAWLITLAMQHSMIWMGTGVMPANSKAARHGDVNYVGGFSGALATSPSDAGADEAPVEGDLETGRLLAKRVAEYAVKTRG